MQNKGEVSESFHEKDERSIAKTKSANKEDRDRSDDYTPRQRIKVAHPLNRPNSAGFSLFQQRPPSPEKKGRSRIEWQNVDSAFSQWHAKEKKDPGEPHQWIEKMI